MSAPSWTECALSSVATDDALDAATALYLVRGNLHRAQQESGYDLQTFQHEDYTMDHVIAAGETWEYFSEFGPWPFMVRHSTGDGYRPLRVLLEGKAPAAVSTTVRIYASRSMPSGPVAITSDGLSAPSYGDITFTSDVWTLASTTIDPFRPGSVSDHWHPSYWSTTVSTPSHAVPATTLVGAIFAASTGTLNTRGLRVDEVA